MKRNTLLNRGKLIAFSMLIAGAMGFTSCGNDDNNQIDVPDNPETKEMFGAYQGKMLTAVLTPAQREESTPDNRADVAAKLDKDTIYLDSIPVRDVVVGIVGEGDAADAIIKAIGKVPYKVGYKPQFNQAKDSIIYKLDPKPLTFSFTLPAGQKAEPTVLNVEVEMSAKQNGTYALATTALDFKLNADKASLVNGSDKAPLEGFKSTYFEFEMKKIKK